MDFPMCLKMLHVSVLSPFKSNPYIGIIKCIIKFVVKIYKVDSIVVFSLHFFYNQSLFFQTLIHTYMNLIKCLEGLVL
jgi:aromatic ring-opening dioxygenase catalytic subunit (LigB family)